MSDMLKIGKGELLLLTRLLQEELGRLPRAFVRYKCVNKALRHILTHL